jgi:hypothetical protein
MLFCRDPRADVLGRQVPRAVAALETRSLLTLLPSAFSLVAALADLYESAKSVEVR